MKHTHHVEHKSDSSEEKMSESEKVHHPHKKDSIWNYIWIITSVFLMIVILIMVFAKNDICAKTNTGTSNTAITCDSTVKTTTADEFIFLYSDSCTTACTTMEPFANDLATKAGMVFRKIKYPQPIEVPGYFVLKGTESTTPMIIQDENTLVVDMCTITKNADICKQADTAKQAITAAVAAAEVEKLKSMVKSDKPKVEIFVMSHCPYGTQIEKGILPVANLLGDKIDLQIKFVNYAMHGKTELDEQMLQYCIETEQNDKYMDYLACFLKEGKSPECVTEVKVDKTKLDSCIAATDAKYKITALFNDKSTWAGGNYPQFPIYDAECKAYGVQGSPTLVINGAEQQTGRDSASLLKAICASFNTAPAECQTQLSSAQPTPGFGFSTTTADATAAQCG
jgi:hypothetical protein